jgi:hypothetical protein
MDGRTFFNLQNVQPGELNGLVSIIDQAIGQAGYETGGRGIVYGLSVAATNPPAMAQTVSPGMALYYDPATTNTGINSNRRVRACRLSTQTSISLTVDYFGAATAVDFGYERWITIVLRSRTDNGDPRTAGDGSPVNFVQTESGELVVVRGTAAAVGSATLPDVSTLGIRVADFKITYGMSVAPAASLLAREDFLTTLPGGDAGAGNAEGYSLFWQSNRNLFAMGTFRLYLCTGSTGYGPRGLCLTWNAAFDPTLKKWFSTDGVPCFALRMVEQAGDCDTGGLMLTQKSVAQTVGWGENTTGVWDTAITLSPARLARVHGSFSYTIPVSIEGMSASVNVGQGGIPTMTTMIQFPCSIPTAQITVQTTEFRSADYGIIGGAAEDAGVANISWYITDTGAILKVLPIGLNTYVRFNRLITISASG